MNYCIPKLNLTFSYLCRTQYKIALKYFLTVLEVQVYSRKQNISYMGPLGTECKTAQLCGQHLDMETDSNINPLAPELFFLNLAHSVYKM